jgi:isocitrate dehydrogenase
VAIKPILPVWNQAADAARDPVRPRRTRKRVVTIMHKGNIQKFTEGAFRDWGYELAADEFRGQIVTERESWILDNRDRRSANHHRAKRRACRAGSGAGHRSVPEIRVHDEVKSVLDKIYATHGKGKWKQKLLINDRIADSIFQQVMTRADEYQVIATPNLERRLYFRRLRRAGRRPGHGARRQHRRRLTAASRPRTAPRRNMPTRTSSTRVR